MPDKFFFSLPIWIEEKKNDARQILNIIIYIANDYHIAKKKL
jgi:hypothetical protein